MGVMRLAIVLRGQRDTEERLQATPGWYMADLISKRNLHMRFVLQQQDEWIPAHTCQILKVYKEAPKEFIHIVQGCSTPHQYLKAVLTQPLRVGKLSGARIPAIREEVRSP